MRKPDHVTLIVHQRYSDTAPEIDTGLLVEVLSKPPIRRRAADGGVTWIYALDENDPAPAR